MTTTLRTRFFADKIHNLTKFPLNRRTRKNAAGLAQGTSKIRGLRQFVLVMNFALLSGCSIAHKPETFTLGADLPPDFAYTAVVTYVPSSGQTCTVPKKDNLKPVFNREWRKHYKPDSEIEIRRVRNGCELVVRSIQLEINASYGDESWDIGTSSALIAIREELSGDLTASFDTQGKSEISGQCQWLFRTIGPQRYITKILDCRKSDFREGSDSGRPFAAYTLDQLPNKTVRLKVILNKDEQPYYKGWWLKSEAGWKPCTGRWGTKNEELCTTPPQFTDFKSPDGHVCTVYPACQE